MTIRFRATIVFEAEAETRDEATLIIQTLIPGVEVLTIGIQDDAKLEAAEIIWLLCFVDSSKTRSALRRHGLQAPAPKTPFPPRADRLWEGLFSPAFGKRCATRRGLFS
jgi:hypothetical protein